MLSHKMIKSAISLWKSVRSAKFKELGQLVTDVYNMNTININNLTNLAVCSTKSTKDKLFFILATRIYFQNLSEMVRTLFCRISYKSELLLKLRRSQTKDILILVKCSPERPQTIKPSLSLCCMGVNMGGELNII